MKRVKVIAEVIQNALSLLDDAKTLSDKYAAVTFALRASNKLLFRYHISDHLKAVGEKLLVEFVSMQPTQNKIHDIFKKTQSLLSDMLVVLK